MFLFPVMLVVSITAYIPFSFGEEHLLIILVVLITLIFVSIVYNEFITYFENARIKVLTELLTEEFFLEILLFQVDSDFQSCVITFFELINLTYEINYQLPIILLSTFDSSFKLHFDANVNKTLNELVLAKASLVDSKKTNFVDILDNEF